MWAMWLRKKRTSVPVGYSGPIIVTWCIRVIDHDAILCDNDPSRSKQERHGAKTDNPESPLLPLCGHVHLIPLMYCIYCCFEEVQFASMRHLDLSSISSSSLTLSASPSLTMASFQNEAPRAFPLPTISEDTLHYALHLPPNDSTTTETDAAALATMISTFVQSLLTQPWLWNKDAWELKVDSAAMLSGTMRVGDAVDDEWLVVWLLREVSRRWPELVIR